MPSPSIFIDNTRRFYHVIVDTEWTSENLNEH